MCGITGFMRCGDRVGPDECGALLGRMTESLAHRGPDDKGCWSDPDAGVWLGHRRLAVLDLSPRGRQPMSSRDGHYVVTYNGEIYNSPALRVELDGLGHRFLGTSDTEVLLAALVQWGVKAAVERLNGIFAFAVWDRAERRLFLARDRLGVKPLYYGWARDGSFLFGSELKALCLWPAFRREVDPTALVQFFRHKYVPDPLTIYRDARKLAPGTMLAVAASGLAARQALPTVYWSAADEWRRGAEHPWTGTEEEAADRLEALLADSVRLQTLSDVPVGALLSGGIDSSAVTAFMQKAGARPIRTFTVGFREATHDEAPMAARIAGHLGTDHTEVVVGPAETQEVVRRIPLMWDEPFADSSQIPTHLICRLARQSVTVVLSGDGGDELFWGYSVYPAAMRSWNRYRSVPGWLRAPAGRLLGAIAPGLWACDHRLAAASARWRLPARLLGRVGELLSAGSFRDFYEQSVSELLPPGGLAVGHGTGPLPYPPARGAPDPRADMSLMDALRYLPGDILAKVDRASMAVGLEARVPILDHRVAAFAAALPPAFKTGPDGGKRILRRVLRRHVPASLTDRPKMGFRVPVGQWLRGPLREWGADVLSADRLRAEGYLRTEAVRALWSEHVSGRRDHSPVLWSVLMFQLWTSAWRPER